MQKSEIITASPIVDLQFTKKEVEKPAEQYEALKLAYEKYDTEEGQSQRSVIRAKEREVASKGIKQKYLGKKNPFKKK